jgi:hypothetical protein
MPTDRLPNGQWPKGVSGAPKELQWQPGHKWRLPKGTSGNPGGKTKRRQEFERLQLEALQNPELLKKAMAKLEEAIDHGEAWGVQWFLNKVWPDDKNLKPPASTRLEVVFIDRLPPEPEEGKLIEAAAEPLPLEADNDTHD